MAYTDIYTAANDATFQGRCMVAMWSAAGDIMSESANTANHGARLDWANRVLQDSPNITPRQLAMQVLRNATIAAAHAAAADSDIQFQVNSVLPSLIQIG